MNGVCERWRLVEDIQLDSRLIDQTIGPQLNMSSAEIRQQLTVMEAATGNQIEIKS